MLKTLVSFGAALLLAGCATREAAPPAAEEPAPVEISESAPPPPAAPSKPAQTDTGRFRISVASLDNLDATKPWVRKAEAAGYRTEILEVVIDGKSYQRVLLPGYASLADAQAALPFVQQDLGAPGAWVTSRRRAPTPDGAPAMSPAAEAPAPPPPAPEAPAPEQPAN